MKKIFLLIAMIAAFNAGAQVVPVLTTTLTPGSGDFLVDQSHYPFDALVLYVMSKDTGKVGFNYTMTGGSFIITKQRVKYVDGRTGLPFASIGRLKQFYDSFMVSPPFTTTISGDLNILGDATAANQVLTIARLDSLAKYQTNKGVTVTHIDSLGTFAVPAGSIVINGLRDSSLTNLTIANVSGLTAIEKGFLNLFPFYSVPMQSYRALATAHTITANVSLNVFVLKLN